MRPRHSGWAGFAERTRALAVERGPQANSGKIYYSARVAPPGCRLWFGLLSCTQRCAANVAIEIAQLLRSMIIIRAYFKYSCKAVQLYSCTAVGLGEAHGEA